MNTINTQATVGEIVTERPSRARVFEQFGIDYCCGGKKVLATACAERGLVIDRVIEALQASDAEPARETLNYATMPLSALAGHIESTHHMYLRLELPRLAEMINKLAGKHGERHPNLVALHQVYHAFRCELESHMFKEERILFPMIREIEQAGGPTQSHCGSVRNPIRVMEHEHNDAGQALARMRELTDNYTPPADACATFRAFYAGLSELEADMHQHVHKENNILFPRAAAMESGATNAA